LNSDCHQFQQYQRYNQLPLILTELTEHKSRRCMTLEIKVLIGDRHTIVIFRLYHGERNSFFDDFMMLYTRQTHCDDVS